MRFLRAGLGACLAAALVWGILVVVAPSMSIDRGTTIIAVAAIVGAIGGGTSKRKRH
jgi:hypothetical protein